MTEIVSGQIAADIQQMPSVGPCPACGRTEAHAHEGWAWGAPESTEGVVRRPVVIPVTPAQRRVLLELTRDGADNRRIAKRLHVSEQTIKTHLKSVMALLPLVRNRTELAVGLTRGTIRTRTTRQRYSAANLGEWAKKGKRKGDLRPVCGVPACGCTGECPA